ncbi:MAG: hypothetical protein ACJAUP_002234 [Cellvibrionaceae bacterium]|jgi:hypothetical protein
MAWHFLDATKVIHNETKFVLELLEGTWSEVVEIRPRNHKKLTPVKQCALIRLGIAEAKKLSIFDLFNCYIQYLPVATYNEEGQPSRAIDQYCYEKS